MPIRSDTIGFIGLGAMGRGMAANCVKKGFRLVVHDIKPEPVAALVKLGAREFSNHLDGGGKQVGLTGRDQLQCFFITFTCHVS